MTISPDTASQLDLVALPTDLYIGGKWTPGSTGQRIEVLDPSTGAAIATVADASIEDAMAAVQAAHDAGPAWAATPHR